MKIPLPIGYVNQPILPPLDQAALAPLPALTVVPTRVDTSILSVDPADADDPKHVVDDLVQRIHEEDARIRRMLPPPPSGMTWEAEMRSQERLNGALEVRLVYQLRDSPSTSL